MKVGVPFEENIYENRISLSPYAVQVLKRQGHTVYVVSQAGERSGFDDAHYKKAGAEIVNKNQELYEKSQLIVKVDIPLKKELSWVTPEHIIMSFMNLMTQPENVLEYVNTGATFIGYESIQSSEQMPVVQSMSKIAGKMAFSIGTEILSKVNKGKGTLIGGSPSASRSKVVIIGGGHAGQELLKMANNAGSRVSVFDNDLIKLNDISMNFPSVETFYPYHELMMKQLQSADLVVGSTFAYKKPVSKLISKEMIGVMEKYSAVIDLSITSGGVFETSKETHLGSPIYAVNDIYHYCVPNIASCVPQTATNALSTSIIPYVIQVTEGLMQESIQIKEAIQIEDYEVKAFVPFIKDKNSNESEKDKKMNSLIKQLSNENDEDGFDNIDDNDLNDY